jgi:hypothetical protein
LAFMLLLLRYVIIRLYQNIFIASPLFRGKPLFLKNFPAPPHILPIKSHIDVRGSIQLHIPHSTTVIGRQYNYGLIILDTCYQEIYTQRVTEISDYSGVVFR